MKKVFALLAISGMAMFYACGNKEEAKTEAPAQDSAAAQTTAPAQDTAHHAAAAQDTAHH